MPGRFESQRIVVKGDRVVGFNMLGSRWNHEPLLDWIHERRPLEWVLKHLAEAQFDEEFVAALPGAARQRPRPRRRLLMQAGLLNTYQHPASNRSWLAWSLSALLFAAYILLYFGPIPALGLRFDLLQRAAEVAGAALGLPAVLHSKWILYGTVYTLAMIVGGAFVLRRHGNSRYQRVRTITVVAVQVVFAFVAPDRAAGLRAARSTTSPTSGRSRSSTSTPRSSSSSRS